ncbi:MAG: hypothetical protein ACJAU6_003655 [Alphaproteobacteria bacterium]
MGLSQEQLDSMSGDSGTIIPDSLTRPAHWPEIVSLPLRDLASPNATIRTVPFIFLSYAGEDRDQIQVYFDFLLEQSVRPWWDQDLPPGVGWRIQIANRLVKSAAVLTFWTKASTQSAAFIEEAANAQSNGKLVHVRLDDAPLPNGFAETQYVDLRDWDGDPNHPAMAKLLQALRDKINSPSPEKMAERIQSASPVAMVVSNGGLSPVDTPPHVVPEIPNPEDLAARLIGLRQSLSRIQTKCDDRSTYQLPQALFHCLDGVDAALSEEPPTWYGLEDSKISLSDCMEDHDAVQSWNNGVVRDLHQLMRRIDQLRPLLQPRQIAPGPPNAKPPEPEPVIRTEQTPELVELIKQAEQALDSPEAKAVLNPDAQHAFRKQFDDLTEAAKQHDEGQKLPRLRGGLRKLAYLTGGVITVVATDVGVNLLTNADAAVTLAQRLGPIYDAILKFFL